MVYVASCCFFAEVYVVHFHFSCSFLICLSQLFLFFLAISKAAGKQQIHTQQHITQQQQKVKSLNNGCWLGNKYINIF